MKIVRCEYKGQTHYAEQKNGELLFLQGEPFDGIQYDGTRVPETEAKLLCPVTPSKALAVGFNYLDHAKEFHKAIPTEPNIFIKPNSCLLAPNEPVLLPRCFTQRVDHESELVIVIGKKARHVAKTDALDSVLGYTCGNDVSARDMQRPDNQWSVCKGFDTFGPVGPCIETEVDPSALNIRMLVNGEARQSSNTRHLIFDVPTLVSYLSDCMTLLPGDIIFTGTTSGVSPLHAGDQMTVEIEGIGSLCNPVEQEL